MVGIIIWVPINKAAFIYISLFFSGIQVQSEQLYILQITYDYFLFGENCSIDFD